MKRTNVFRTLSLMLIAVASMLQLPGAKASSLVLESPQFAKGANFVLLVSEYVNPYTREGRRMAAEKLGTNWSWAIIGLLVLLSILIVILIIVRIRLSEMLEKNRLEKNPDTYYEKASWWEIFRKVEKDAPLDAPIQGHDYDGIVELDNNPPAWFNWLFFVPIITGVIYVMYYHVLDLGKLQEEEYTAAMMEAEASMPEIVLDFSTMEALTAIEDIQAGGKIFKGNCAPCHLENGGGGAGPNLTDAYWLHGGDFPSVYQTIYEGVEGKGMAAWGDILLSEQVHQVASYLETLRNTNVEGGKQAEGELYE